MNAFSKQIALTVISLSLAGCWGHGKDVSEQLAQAQQFLDEGNAPKARIELENALKIDPANAQANLLIARIDDKAGDLSEAVPHYLRAARPDAHLLEPQLRVAEILIESKRLNEALGLINSAIGAFPNSADAVALRASAEEALDQVAAARADVSTVLQRDPTNPKALTTQAVLFLRDRNGSAALDSVDRGLTRDPNNIRLLQVRAAALLTLDQPDKAAEALRTIIRTAPENVSAQKVLAGIETRNGQFAEAEAQFRSAVEADPANEAMQLAFIDFLAGQKKDTSVIDYLNQLIQSHRDTNTYDLILAEFHRQHGDLQASTDVILRAIARLGDSKAGLDTRVALAKIKAAAGRSGEAQAVIAEVLAANPTNKDALAFRAVLEIEAGRNDSAIADLLEVLRQNPVDGTAYQNLATAYLNAGQAAQAVSAMRRAVALTPEDAYAQIKLAAFLQRGGDLNGAKDIVARETLRHPDVPGIWVASAQLDLDRKDWNSVSRALAHLRQMPEAGDAATVVGAYLSLAQGDAQSAFSALRPVIESGAPLDSTIISAFSQASLSARQAAVAVKLLDARARSLTGDPLRAALRASIVLQASLGHLDEAGQSFTRLVATQPQSIEPYNTYVTALIEAHAFSQAQAVITAGIAAGAPKWSLLLLKASVFDAAGDARSTMNSYKQALDENPASLPAANNYASLLSDLDPKNTAALQAARDRFNGLEGTSNPSLADTIAWLDYRLGRFDEAKALLTRSAADKSASPQIRFHLAAVLIASGNKADGLALLDTVKGLSFPGADEVRSLSDS